MNQLLINSRYFFVTYSTTFLVLLFAVSACVPVNNVRVHKDSAPSVLVDPNTIADAIPRASPVTRAGNKNPYTVLGKTYHLLADSKGYKERGVASWYGTKFQGRPTANGEAYNLYAMTAAHRTLPIPAYVRVTNLDNNRTAIVRVNDRGPFHQDRIIDLSYAAAVKLGYAERGTARVEVEALDSSVRKTPKVQANTASNTTPNTASNTTPNTASNTTTDAANNERFFLQVGAFRSLELATKLRAELLLQTQQNVKIRASEPAGYYQVRIGPLVELAQVQQVSEQLLRLNMGRPQLISE